MFLKHTKWAMLWALLIFVLCSIPGKDIPHVSYLELLEFDKFIHAFLFFILVLLTVRGLKLQKKFPNISKLAMITAVTASVLYGGLLEIMQGMFFDGRSTDIYDFIANTFGCLLATLFYSRLEKNI